MSGRALRAGAVAGVGGGAVGGVVAAIATRVDTAAAGPADAIIAGTLAAGVIAVAIGGAVGFVRAGVRRARLAYLQALQRPGPEAVVAVVEGSVRSLRSTPAGDALLAQGRALAYALYGREEAAREALAAITWDRRAPVVEAVGVSAGAIVALLCRGDASEALALARRARSLAKVSRAMPGARETLRWHALTEAACEAALGTASPAALRLLDAAIDDGKSPVRQLLAAFARREAAERSGDADRAAVLRAWLAAVAPHCAPLRR